MLAVLWLGSSTGCAHSQGQVTGAQNRASLALESVNAPYQAQALADQVVVVYFFATYCFPCLAQVPLMESLHQQYRERGVKILGVGMDLEGARVLRPFAQAYRLEHTVLAADQALLHGESSFGRIAVLPATVVLNRRGDEAAAFAGLPGKEDLVRAIEVELGR